MKSSIKVALVAFFCVPAVAEEIPLPKTVTAEWDKVFTSDAELHGYLFALDARCPPRFRRQEVSDYLDTMAVVHRRGHRLAEFDNGYALGVEDYAAPLGQAFCMKLVGAENMFKREGRVRRRK